MRIFANRAYLSTGWANDVLVHVEQGKIAGLDTEADAHRGDHSVDVLLPAMSNLHSHAFQRAMAGMTEYRAKGKESFWTWRTLMYRYLDQLTPDQISAVSELAFMEMLVAGYAAVGEFHYVHHAPGGQPYDDLAELSARAMYAAQSVGLGMTHLPVLYTYGGVDGRPLTGGQKRFGNDVDQFSALVERCHTIARDLPPDTSIGIAPHSLRATNPDDLSRIVERFQDGPVHMHIAEQQAEVEEVRAHTGARPVEWLLGHVDVSDRWCLIHATHMTDAEAQGLANRGAVAGLCPVTEANLGDGVFNGPVYQAAGGRLGIGSDSNINISVPEELRMLEYSQRLFHRERNVLAPEAGSTGEWLYTVAAAGGAHALNRNTGAIEVGKLADLVAIDTTDACLCLLQDDQIFDGFIFAGSDRVITDVWSAGRHQVQNGRHIARDEIVSRFRQSLSELK